ncbi:ParA family protein [Halonatronum saccharophilum]|uniref:ParA family protein n=1 Tax=Halonatronum saccharophilum TaxID=150060 RepID=UPI000483D157|nr:ParA family protein [Halonatronum saccharophilum]
MTKVVSFINLKGGVGKTTIAVNVAASLAQNFNKRVLIIDLDPQTNATVSLIPQEEWIYRDKESKQTLFHMFNDLINEEQNFDMRDAIIQGVSHINNLDLLPSSLGLVEIQDFIPDIDRKAFINHVDVLGNQLTPILNNREYDYIIIDCPPNLGAITLNGITISDYYIIPTIPDILSKIGINLVLNRIRSFKRKKKTCNINLAGIIFSKVDYRTNLHNSTMQELRYSDLNDYVFKNELPQRISVSEAPMDNKPFITSPTARNKSDFYNIKQLIDNIAREFIYMTS